MKVKFHQGTKLYFLFKHLQARLCALLHLAGAVCTARLLHELALKKRATVAPCSRCGRTSSPKSKPQAQGNFKIPCRAKLHPNSLLHRCVRGAACNLHRPTPPQTLLGAHRSLPLCAWTVGRNDKKTPPSASAKEGFSRNVWRAQTPAPRPAIYTKQASATH